MASIVVFQITGEEEREANTIAGLFSKISDHPSLLLVVLVYAPPFLLSVSREARMEMAMEGCELREACLKSGLSAQSLHSFVHY